jgi:acyl-CoA thioesterase-1
MISCCMSKLPAAQRRTAPSIAFVLLALVAVFAACSRPGPAPEQPQPDPPVAPVPAASAPASAPPEPASSEPRPKIVAFGDSLTAGFGLEKNQSYPAVLQRLLDDRGYHYEVVNSGVSGETSAGGVRRIDRALGPDVRVVIVELGGNDGLRGLPAKDLKKNLAQIVDAAKARGATVLLTGMEAPPYLGADYTAQFRSVFGELAKEKHVQLMPFFLAGVAGDPDLNQVDGIHPNQRGAEVVAENVLKTLQPLLEK